MDVVPSGEKSATVVSQTKRKSLMQVLVCVGCCCGRVERGKPEVPVDWLKAQWKAARLNPYIQLTISGCLGPCDLPNVVAVLTVTGQQWIGQLDRQKEYRSLGPMGACLRAGRRLESLPPVLNESMFKRI